MKILKLYTISTAIQQNYNVYMYFPTFNQHRDINYILLRYVFLYTFLKCYICLTYVHFTDNVLRYLN